MRRIFALSLMAWLSLPLASAQGGDRAPDSEHATEIAQPAGSGEYLDDDDRLSLIAAALDRHVRRTSEPDCSHLVHAIYAKAGFSYPYAPSSDLYAGIENFERVKQPQPGDLIVWKGHVGIVIKPSTHIFFSFMSSGPGVDDYTAPYWKHRGKPRFYHYVKSSPCDECVQRKQSHRLVKIKR